MKMKPLVLIANDDGYFSDALGVLVEKFKQEFQVVVVAPDTNRSGVGRGLSLEMPIRVREIEQDFYAISGTPVDCVCWGLGYALKDRKPDLVVTGINIGANLGTDVLSSGTLCSAMEGFMRGIPSIAVSQQERGNYKAAASLALMVGKTLIGGKPLLLNINTPNDKFIEARWTRLGKRGYDYKIDQSTDPRGGRYFWIGGGSIKTLPGKGTDCQAILDGCASITPLQTDLTDDEMLFEMLSKGVGINESDD